MDPTQAPELSQLAESSVRPSRIEFRGPEGFQLVKTSQNGAPKSPKIMSKIQGLSSSRGFLVARLGCKSQSPAAAEERQPEELQRAGRRSEKKLVDKKSWGWILDFWAGAGE